jgi:hypothetical protein
MCVKDSLFVTHSAVTGFWVERGSVVNMLFEIVGSGDIALPWLEIWSIFG